MTSYEDDHNIQPSGPSNPSNPVNQRRLRPDQLTFATFQDMDPFSSMNRDGLLLVERSLTLDMVDQLLDSEKNHSRGVPSGFTDTLERVEKKKLKKEDVCCICNSRFLEDPYPLVVRLPCHSDHIFDLECIAEWLKLHRTCPLDRVDVVKKKEPPPPPPVDDEEEVWDEDYA